MERVAVPLKWLWSLQDPSLEEDEPVRLESIATSNRGLLAPSGRLLLTSKRLVFIPSRLALFPRRLWPKGLDVPLASIESVELGGAMAAVFAGAPGLPQFIVKVRGGPILKFQTLDAKAWHREIALRISPSRMAFES